MYKDKIAKTLRLHILWRLGDPSGIRADLRNADLCDTDLCGADLRGADLRGADLRGADLRGADLRGAGLCDADLQRADLRDADLRGAGLCDADLCGADLRNADLRNAGLCDANLCGADLRGADLRGADLRGADLRGADLPAPPTVLLAYWCEVSDDLCSCLMNYDATNHPDPALFDKWAAGGPCPYDGVRVERAANFRESRVLYNPKPALSAFTLMVRVIRECCADSDYHDKKPE